jgi:hypothetical protein
MSWASSNTARATVTNSNSPTQTVTIFNNPGTVDILATATATVGWTGSVTGKGTFTVTACDTPWFFRDSTTNCSSGSCQDQNFSTYYCAGSGTSALPLFTYSGSGTSTCQNPSSPTHLCGVVAGSQPDPNPVKEFFFKESNTSRDAIGIRVYRNVKKLSPLGWYRDRFGTVKSPGATTIGGYPAVQDGSTYYVAAANLDGSTLYDYIFVLSYNADASAPTLAIWQQFISHLAFTLNASTSRADLAHDIAAVGGLADVSAALTAKGKPYPLLSAGSYLTGFSTSAWPSWNQTLGAALGTSLPTSPDQGFPSCPAGTGYEASTCWRQSTRDFRCVPNPDPQSSDDSVLAYRASGGSVNLYANLWYSGPGTWRNFSGNACSGIGAGTSTVCSCFNYNLLVP